MKLKITKGHYNISGVTYINKGFNFCFSVKTDSAKKNRKKDAKTTPVKDVKCAVILVNIEDPNITETIEIPTEYIIGEMCAVHISGIDYTNYGYVFKINDEIVMDSYAKRVYGHEVWAKESESSIFAGFKLDNAKNTCLHLNKQDMVMYHLNVHNFTQATGTKDAGTFLALKKKLPYIKELGITALQIMPIYEFNELENDKINVWGYTGGYYFAPKAAYAYSKDVTGEFASLIKACHDNGIMVILDFFADKKVSPVFAVEAMKYYVSEYGIDGFNLMGEGINTDIVLNDPLLKKTYFFKDYFTDEQIYNDSNNRLFVQNDDFLYAMRKLISTKSGNMNEAYSRIIKQSNELGFVNYITSHNGFTMYDLFSYASKHNEANMEANRDGNDYNLSINCGIEGPTKKKDIINKRIKCMYNAIAMMMLSQGVPMLLAGDEKANSQDGNNNAYCQDNELGWVTWKNNAMTKAVYSFTKNIIAFRNEHKMISRPVPHAFKDTKNAGLPDVSLHGTEAWIGSLGWDATIAGVCYCGKFADEKDDIYLAFNFSKNQAELALPAVSGKEGWEKVMDTSKSDPFNEVDSEVYSGTVTVPEMTVVILKSKDAVSKNLKGRKK